MSTIASGARKPSYLRLGHASDHNVFTQHNQHKEDDHRIDERWSLLSQVVGFILRTFPGLCHALGIKSDWLESGGAQGQPPANGAVRDLTHLLVSEATHPFAISPCCDLYKRTLQGFGTVVVRRIRFQSDEIDGDRALEKQSIFLIHAENKHILPFLGTCVFDGSLCIVSPFASGGDLRKLLKAEPDCNRRSLLFQVAEGLEYLHGRGMIHGNLHPGNVLLSHDRTVMLSEFGLAEIVPDEGSTSMRPAFAREKAMHRAPEVHMGEPLALSCDIYSFGMLTFHVYSDGEPMRTRYPGAIQVSAALLSGRRPERQEISRGDFSSGLWDLVQQCWAHDKAKRPSAARARLDLGLDSRSQASDGSFVV